MIVKYKKYILSAVAASALLGCSREAVDSGKHGYLTAGIEQDMSVNVIKTKADVSADDPFTLNIYKGSELLNTISDHRTLLTEPLQLNCAKYKVTAQNRETVEAVFDSPRYYGEADETVHPDRWSMQMLPARFPMCWWSLLLQRLISTPISRTGS